ncbi:MAG: STAS domain-containing protein [Calditrichaeota bacterium]|jgi:anti-sigma B factor antagonist|nr:STAS domain-containing protein [Calditrichota bacterium]
MNPRINIDVEHRSNVAVVKVAGEVDLYSSPELRKAILSQAEKRPSRLVVDLSGVQYMDSSGVATLVEGLQKLEQNGGELVLCGLGDMVQEVFKLTRLDSVFQILPSLEEALAEESAGA